MCEIITGPLHSLISGVALCHGQKPIINHGVQGYQANGGKNNIKWDEVDNGEAHWCAHKMLDNFHHLTKICAFTQFYVFLS